MANLDTNTVIAGSTFGFALVLVGICAPKIITSQFTGDNFSLFAKFLAISTSNILLLPLFSYLSIKKPSPRSPSPLPFLPGLGRYGGNVVGGAIQGIAMALVGASPETLLVQVAGGADRSLWILMGCLLGGIVYVAVREWGGDNALPTPPAKQRDEKPIKAAEKADNIQHMKDSGVNEDTVKPSPSSTAGAADDSGARKMSQIPYGKAVYVILLLILTLDQIGTYGPDAKSPSSFFSALIRASPIALSQMVTISLTGNPLGVSGMYENIGLTFWHALSVASKGSIDPLRRGGGPWPARKSAVFAVGVALGGWYGLALGVDPIERYTRYTRSGLEISAITALLGGFLMALGSRISGGCTSGHGISGLSAMSASSFVTIGSMGAAGIATGLMLRYE